MKPSLVIAFLTEVALVLNRVAKLKDNVEATQKRKKKKVDPDVFG